MLLRLRGRWRHSRTQYKGNEREKNCCPPWWF